MSDGLKKILYVEDEPDIAEVAKLALETVGGFEVMVCPKGSVALEKAPSYGPDLILLDVMMPEMDGPTTLLELRKIDSLKNIPVAFMTAKVQANEIAEYKGMGAIDIIPKPFDPMTLSEQVQAIWQKAS